MIKQEHFSTKPPHPASTPPLSSHSGGGVGGLPYPPPPYLGHSMHPSASSQHNLLHQSHPMDSHLQVALKTRIFLSGASTLFNSRTLSSSGAFSKLNGNNEIKIGRLTLADQCPVLNGLISLLPLRYSVVGSFGW